MHLFLYANKKYHITSNRAAILTTSAYYCVYCFREANHIEISCVCVCVHPTETMDHGDIRSLWNIRWAWYGLCLEYSLLTIYVSYFLWETIFRHKGTISVKPKMFLSSGQFIAECRQHIDEAVANVHFLKGMVMNINHNALVIDSRLKHNNLWHAWNWVKMKSIQCSNRSPNSSNIYFTVNMDYFVIHTVLHDLLFQFSSYKTFFLINSICPTLS